MPESGYEHSGLADLEVYDDRFRFGKEESELDYLISIQKAESPGE